MSERNEYTEPTSKTSERGIKVDEIRQMGAALASLTEQIDDLGDEQEVVQDQLAELRGKWNANFADGETPSAEAMIELIQKEEALHTILEEMIYRTESLRTWIDKRKKDSGAVEKTNDLPQNIAGRIIN